MASRYSDDEYEHDSDDEFDEDIGMWVGNPFKYGNYDNEGNYIEKEVKEEEEKVKPLAVPVSKGKTESVETETRKDKLKRLMREKMAREKAERKSAAAVVASPVSKGDADLAAARIGLPSGWEAHLSRTYGKVFYYNQKTGERVWERPSSNNMGKGGRKSVRRRGSRAKQPKRRRSMKRSMKRRTIRRK